MSGPVILKLLGPPLVEVDARPIELTRRKTLALLARLAVESREHARDCIAALLWPECDQSRARSNLRSSIFELNHVLGDGLLIIRQDLLRLDNGNMRIDVDAFLNGAVPCESHDPDLLCPECASRAETSISLWRAPFLSGFSLRDCPDFDEWQLSTSGRLRGEYCVLLRRLTAYYRRLKQYWKSEAFALSWIREEPFEEEARLARVEILQATGRRRAAAESIDEWAQVSRIELCRPLSRRMESLARELRETDSTTGTATIVLAGFPEAAPRDGPSVDGPGWMIGRDEELSELSFLLRGGGCRLCSITGAGGIGKTLLARHVLRSVELDFPEGAYFVELAVLRESSQVPGAVAREIRILESRRSEKGVEEAILSAIGRSRRLLVLDNLEHLPGTRGFVKRLLESCPYLAILVTSRERLDLPGERECRLRTLAIPPRALSSTRAGCEGYLSVRLFSELARSADPDFSLSDANASAVSSICRRLDGLPLALELAAARLAVLEPQELLSRLDHRFDLLHAESPDLPERHRTLLSVIAWSWELLDERDRRVFAALAVFPGGFDLAAAETVCEAPSDPDPGALVDSLASLVGKSLVVRYVEGGATRFRMMESIREFAAERLAESPGCRTMRLRHAAHYLSLTECETPALHGRRQSSALVRLEREHMNLRTTLDFLLSSEDTEAALRLVSSLEWYWHRSGRWNEGRAFIKACMSLPLAGDFPALRGRALRALGWLDFVQGEWREARGHFLEAERLLRAEEDRAWLARSLSDLGVVECWLGNRESGMERAREAIALARDLGDPGMVSRALVWAYGTNGGRKMAEDQDERLEEAVRCARRAGDCWTEAHALESLGDSLREEGLFNMAGACFEEGLQGFDELGDAWMKAWSLEGLGMNDCLKGDPSRGLLHLRKSLRLFEGSGARLDAVYVLGELGIAVGLLGDDLKSDLLLGASYALRDEPIDRTTGIPSGAGLPTQAPSPLDRALATAAARKSAAWCRGIRLRYDEAIRLAEAAPGVADP